MRKCMGIFKFLPYVNRIGKEIEKELKEDEEKAAQQCNGDSKKTGKKTAKDESLRPTCKGLRERANLMPRHIRSVHAQREKEKGNEVSWMSIPFKKM